MMRVLSAIKKEMLEIRHDRTMLMIIAAFPVFIMLFMGSSFGSVEIQGLPVGVVGPGNTTFSGILFSDLNASGAFNLKSFESEEAAMEEFRNGHLKSIIIVPDDFEASLRTGEGAEIRIIVDNSDIALQKAIMAAMASVIQASSTNITQSYVSAAWDDLYELNDSAASLSGEISESREEMEKTVENLAKIRQNMNKTDIRQLEHSLEAASRAVSQLQGYMETQQNDSLLNDSVIFLHNASFALNESIRTVGDTHGKISSQTEKLNETLGTLEISITALELARTQTTDPLTSTALGINILSLKSLYNNTKQQMNDAQAQAEELESLNQTLQSFRVSLETYSEQLSNTGEEQAEALEGISDEISALNASLAESGQMIKELTVLMSGIDNTTEEIELTLGRALEQIDSVDELISSLQDTVKTQTMKNPDTIATPLSVSVENQYVRKSFVDFTMPQVIAVSLLFSCFLLASISIVREKTSKTVVRLLMVPGGLTNAVIAKAASISIISMGQVGVIIAIAVLLFGVRAPENALMLVVGTLVSALVLSSIGILLGFYAKSESAAIQSSLMIAIPMLFLGNIVFSPDLLPSYTQVLQQLLPLAHITNIFKVILITGGDPGADLAALLSYFVLLALATTIILYTRKDITNYM